MTPSGAASSSTEVLMARKLEIGSAEHIRYIDGEMTLLRKEG